MAQATTKDLTTLPVGRLGLIPLISCKDLGEKVNEWLIQWRKERSHEELDSFAFEGYQRDSYLIPVQTARFGSGEAKCTIMESVRGDDIYLMVDVCNYSLTYSIGPYEQSKRDHALSVRKPPEYPQRQRIPGLCNSTSGACKYGCGKHHHF